MQPACQCDLNWLRNETGAWLNKWLATAQTRPIPMSNSTVASSGHTARPREAKRESSPSSDASWVRSRPVGTEANRKSSGDSKLGSRFAALGSVAPHRQPLKFGQAERGPQGPKVSVQLDVRVEPGKLSLWRLQREQSILMHFLAAPS